MQRTLKRESKELEIVEREAIATSEWGSCGPFLLTREKRSNRGGGGRPPTYNSNSSLLGSGLSVGALFPRLWWRPQPSMNWHRLAERHKDNYRPWGSLTAPPSFWRDSNNRLGTGPGLVSSLRRPAGDARGSRGHGWPSGIARARRRPGDRLVNAR